MYRSKADHSLAKIKAQLAKAEKKLAADRAEFANVTRPDMMASISENIKLNGRKYQGVMDAQAPEDVAACEELAAALANAHAIPPGALATTPAGGRFAKLKVVGPATGGGGGNGGPVGAPDELIAVLYFEEKMFANKEYTEGYTRKATLPRAVLFHSPQLHQPAMPGNPGTKDDAYFGELFAECEKHLPRIAKDLEKLLVIIRADKDGGADVTLVIPGLKNPNRAVSCCARASASAAPFRYWPSRRLVSSCASFPAPFFCCWGFPRRLSLFAPPTFFF